MAEKKPMDNGKFAALIMAGPKRPAMGEPKGPMSDEPAADADPMMGAYKELIDAFHARDPMGLRTALEAIVPSIMEKSESEESEGAEPAEPAESIGNVR